MASGVWGAACVEQQQLGLTEVLTLVEVKRNAIVWRRSLRPLYKIENQILHSFRSLPVSCYDEQFCYTLYRYQKILCLTAYNTQQKDTLRNLRPQCHLQDPSR